MTDVCTLVADALDAGDALDPAMAAHAAACPRCLAQLRAHDALTRGFGAVAPPALTPGFAARTSRLVPESPRRRRRIALAIELAYWTAVVGGAGAIVRHAPRPHVPHTDVLAPWIIPAGFAIVFAAGPLARAAANACTRLLADSR